MALAAGTRLGIYEISGPLGAGGMGEVYRARDTKLGREVAIKTLPLALAQDPDRLARFEREAKLLGALNHVHIGAIYGLDEHEGTQFIAMELVEGETLEQKLKAGPLPVEDALRLALQIAAALEAAHDKGVVHRDLKPANVMVTRDGSVKVLDFGLAKAFSTEPSDTNPAQSPALSVAMTQQGLILGTAGYMSPEQASGQTTDQRADVWGFGVVLYEMLTGLPLFSGESVPHILADVLRSEPNWSRLPKSVHPRLKLLLERCLAKKPRSRLHSIADARIEIEALLADPHGAAGERGGPEAARSGSLPQRLAVAVVLLAVGAVVAGVAAWTLKPEPQRPLRRFSYRLPSDQSLLANQPNLVNLAVSPDGRRFAYSARVGDSNTLFVRELGELDARPIPGAGTTGYSPFFSPDGESLAYFSAGSLRRIAIGGGAPVTVTAEPNQAWGASWGADQKIYYALQDGSISRVSANGGAPERVTEGSTGEQEQHATPVLLPDGDTLLFSEKNAQNTWDQGQVAAQSLSTGKRTVLIRGGADARYVPPGYLVYVVGSDLFGVAFEPKTLTVSGAAVSLVQGVARGAGSASANFGVAADGTLVYIRGGVGAAQRTLAWIDRSGREEPIAAPPRAYTYVQLSPDGTRLAVDIRDQDNDIWIYDLTRATLQRLTFDAGANAAPIWSPDGRRVAFTQLVNGVSEVYWQAADGSGMPEPLTRGSAEPVLPSAFSPDGKTLFYSDGPAPRKMWTVAVDGDGRGTALEVSPASSMNGTLSPNGRWLAYQSNESGRDEIYVRPYPDVASGRWQVSTAGGQYPLWRRDGQELFYIAPEGPALMAVAIDADTRWRSAGAPQKLFAGNFAVPNVWRQIYDVTPDGQRFVMIKNAAAAETAEFVIVENWVEELERRMPRN